MNGLKAVDSAMGHPRRPPLCLALLSLVLMAAPALHGQVRVAKGAIAARPFDIAIIGDMPYIPHPDTGAYGAAVMREYQAVLSAIAASAVRQVVHVGDITGFHCADSVLALRRREFDAMPRPLVLAVGDNEWIDCGRTGFDPLDRLDRVRSLFFSGDSSMGRVRLRLERQSESGRFAEMRENVRWRDSGVLFVTLHVVPLPHGYLESPARAREQARRDSANIAWLRDSFARASEDGLSGIVLFFQANPGWGTELRPEYVRVRSALVSSASSFRGAVAVVHGDSHLCRVDRPAVDLAGRPLPDVIRAETFGNPRHHWLRMRVTPGTHTLFRFTPEFVAGNAPATCQVHGRLVTPESATAADR